MEAAKKSLQKTEDLIGLMDNKNSIIDNPRVQNIPIVEGIHESSKLKSCLTIKKPNCREPPVIFKTQSEIIKRSQKEVSFGKSTSFNSRAVSKFPHIKHLVKKPIIKQKKRLDKPKSELVSVLNLEII